MKFTDIFIKRPILAASLSMLIVLLGLYSALQMQVREYPKMTNTQITVTTGYYGASADLIQGFITQPLEQAVAQADNIEYITSESIMGRSVITAQMKLNTEPNGALAEILAKVNSVKSKLPKEAQDPAVAMSTGSTTAVLYVGFVSDSLSSSQITDYLERVIKPNLFSVNGVAKIDLYGGVSFALRVWIDPVLLAQHDITASEVVSVLNANNFQSASGQVVGEYVLHNSVLNSQIKSPDELERLVIREKNGEVIRLSDVATVDLSKSHDTYRASANGQEAVVAAIAAAPSANPINIAADVHAMLPELERNMPSTIEMRVMYDSTVAINASINEVIMTLLEAGVIVLVVITLFLGSLRATLIPIITIPLSLIGVAMVMSAIGFTWNLMTLLAMVLAIGLVVDDAIVVLENVDRHIKMGKKPFEAAIIGTREIAVPVIAMTLALCAVYAPIALMGGVTGSLFKEFALTLAGAVVVSGVVALTLSPVMCSSILKANDKPSRFESGVHNFLDGMSSAYGRSLKGMMNYRRTVLVFAATVMLVMPVLFKLIPSELAPSEDKGVMMLMGNGPVTANLDYLENTMKEVNAVLSDQTEVKYAQVFAGVPKTNMAMGIASLVPWDDREAAQSEITARVAKEVGDIPGMSVAAFQLPELPGAGGGFPFQFVIKTSDSFENLFVIANEMLNQFRAGGAFVFATLDLNFESGTLKINVDREMASHYGVQMSEIATTLSTFISDGYINRVELDGRAYEVIPQLKRKDRLNPEDINDYYVRTSSGELVPLSLFVTMDIEAAPSLLPHFNQLNSATISAVPNPAKSMGDAVEWAEAKAAEVLPKGYTYDYLGSSRQYIQEGSALYVTFGLALAIIFLVLAIQFESLRDPLVIMVSVPLAVCGALVAMAWGLSTMNIYAQIGLVTLIGLITKHGILICEVAKESQLHKQMNRMDSVVEAATIRLRPILMTAISMIAGLVPLMFATGAGAEQRFSIGIVIIAGLAIGTLFTLYVLPVIYTYLAQKHKPLREFHG
ncbi:multidrug efflux RND transporter permease subunit [Vibrio barjaei]|nr:multidrug efflux RND transporter permease subunit [Vibrio barjaei]